jgi:CubicO group peptidase (beta-lactamase class C family)
MNLDHIIQPFIDNQSLLGTAVTIIKNNEVVYSKGFGKASVETNLEVTPTTLFSLGSVSKIICATLVMRLVEEGRLELDTPIITYLPDLKFSNQNLGNKITLRHVLSHTTGLPASGKTRGPRYPEALGEFVHEQIPYYSFLAEPGKVFLYSNTVFCIAGHVAEAVTGKYYDALIQEYVLDPLGMTSVSFDPAIYATYPLALPHTKEENQPFQVLHRLSYNQSGNPSAFAYGHVLDLARLATMFLNKGHYEGKLFLNPLSIQEMYKPEGKYHTLGQTHPIDNTNRDYGLGFWSGIYKDKHFVGHDGRDSTYVTAFHLFPHDNAALLLMTNYANEDALAELLVTLYDYVLDLPYQGVVRLAKPATIPIFQNLDSYQGTFLNVGYGVIADFFVKDSHLFLHWEGKDIKLIHFGKHQFYGELSELKTIPVTFLENTTDLFQHVMIFGNPYHRLTPNEDHKPDLQLWQTYEGIYKDPSNTDPNALLSVKLQEGVLELSEGTGWKSHCQPLDDTLFLAEGGVVEFRKHSLGYILVWGKATPYFPVNATKWRGNKIVEYLFTPYTS